MPVRGHRDSKQDLLAAERCHWIEPLVGFPKPSCAKVCCGVARSTPSFGTTLTFLLRPARLHAAISFLAHRRLLLTAAGACFLSTIDVVHKRVFLSHSYFRCGTWRRMRCEGRKTAKALCGLKSSDKFTGTRNAGWLTRSALALPATLERSIIAAEILRPS